LILLDRIRNWRLKHKVPKGTRFRYAPNGLDKIFVDVDDEVRKYNYARKREKDLKKKHGI